MSRIARRALPLAGLLALLLAVPGAAAAAALQAAPGELGAQTLGRGYTHVFLAYALAWALVLGWVVSIARRLARIEHRLDDDDA